jgi:hypothetical protein
LLVEPDDPEVCGPAPEQRYRLHRKRATMSMPWLLVSAIAVGQDRSCSSRPWRRWRQTDGADSGHATPRRPEAVTLASPATAI